MTVFPTYINNSVDLHANKKYCWISWSNREMKKSADMHMFKINSEGEKANCDIGPKFTISPNTLKFFCCLQL